MIRFVFDQLFKFLHPLLSVIVWIVGVFVPNHVSGPFPLLHLKIAVSVAATLYLVLWPYSVGLASRLNHSYPSEKWRFLPPAILGGFVLLCNRITTPA